MFAKRFGQLVPVLTVLTLASTGLFAFDAPELAPRAPASQDVLEELDLAAANWTFVGCIQLGSTCYDVFEDNKGDWWVCQECFTTQNPSPKKCRRLTPWEIINSLWCV